MKAPEVRVLAGRWKGRRLEASASARPTSSKARQALFNILGTRIAGARVLDLYAGTGAVGIEAVSRGAAGAVLVEAQASALRRCVERIGAEPSELRVVAGSVRETLAELSRRGEVFDLLFADPPYGAARDGNDLEDAATVLRRDGSLVLQQDLGDVAAELPGLVLTDRREYGRNVFFFYGMR